MNQAQFNQKNQPQIHQNGPPPEMYQNVHPRMIRNIHQSPPEMYENLPPSMPMTYEHNVEPNVIQNPFNLSPQSPINQLGR